MTAPNTTPPAEWRWLNHWRFIHGQDQEFRIEPRHQGYVAILVAVVIAALIALVWVVPRMPVESRIILCFIGVMAGTVLVAFLVWHNRYELRLGPYLVYDGKAILLRHGQRVDLVDFVSFEVIRRWHCDYPARISHLTITCKSRNQIEVLHSVYRREVVKLKKQLDEAMASRECR